MKRLAALLAIAVLSGCATRSPSPESNVVRARAPVNYETAVSNYFDLTGAPAHRKLAFGAPEASKCALFGGAGRHQGWVVPVVYDTSTQNAGAKTSGGKPAAAKTTPPNELGIVTLEEVSLTGTRYFFWFSNDTISAVTRRADLCP